MNETIVEVNGWLDQLFVHGPVWVYFVLALACFVENIFPPFPGDTFILVAGGLVSLGRLELFTAISVMIFGGLLSVMLIYFLGRNYGREFFIRKNYRYFSAIDVVNVETRLKKWGALVLVVSRFAIGIRTVLALVAGIGKYPVERMLLFSFLSYVLFVTLIMYLASEVVDNLDELASLAHTYDRFVIPVLAGIVALFLIRHFRKATNKGTA